MFKDKDGISLSHVQHGKGEDSASLFSCNRVPRERSGDHKDSDEIELPVF